MRKHYYWLTSIFITLLLRIWLLVSASVPFNGDEAVVALMARHITQGARPMFFYGQAYMGSLDAFLVAVGFSLFGEAIWVIRVVQILLYCGFLYTGWLLARRVLVDARAADLTVLIMAVPPVMVTLYTSATLGGYGETLIFGNLILLLGYEVVYGSWQNHRSAWLGLGLVGGLAFWTLGMSGVYLLPVGIAGLINIKRLKPGLILVAALAFLLGSLPWWIENFTNNWSAMAFLLGESELKLPLPSFGDRILGFLFLGLPTLFGFRRPWEGGFEPIAMVITGVALMITVIGFAVEVRRRQLPIFKPGAGPLFLWMISGFTLIFIGTQFSIDSTGRYFVPLYPVISMGFGGLFAWVSSRWPRWGWSLVGLVLVFNFIGVYRAANEPEGLTTQFAPITRFSNEADADLISFLEENDLRYGYSNYWVSFRLAFLSAEKIIFSPKLPYQADRSYTINDNRYPAYDDLVGAQDTAAFITTLHPELDAALAERWSDLGITYKEKQIGPYHVFYEHSQLVRPEQLDIYVDR